MTGDNRSEGSLKLLLVDDEQELVQTLAERLAARGLEAEVAYDGEQALELVALHRPAVVVLDLRMPGMDGTQVLRLIKMDRPRTQVIILTGHGSHEDEILTRDLGAFAYFRKPANIEKLADKIREALAVQGRAVHE